MEKKAIITMIERMRKDSRIKSSALSAYINMLMRAGKIDEVYELLSRDNLEMLLRSIIKQYLNYLNEDFLKLEVFEEIIVDNGLENEMLIHLFMAAIKQNNEMAVRNACKTFCETCDLLFKYKNRRES